MALLLLEPESRSLAMLESSLKGLFSAPTITLRKSTEALNYLKKNSSRVELFIAHESLFSVDPSANAVVAERLGAFSPLLVLSDGKRGKGRDNVLRADGWLVKPFNLRALTRGIGRAFHCRARTRPQVLIWEESGSLRGLSKNTDPHLLFAKDLAQFRNLLRENDPSIGALVIDSKTFARQANDQLIAVLKQRAVSFSGRLTPLICIGNDSAVPAFLRARAERFVSQISSAEHFNILIATSQKRSFQIWETRMSRRTSLASLKRHHYLRARWSAWKGSLRESNYCQFFNLKAEIALKKGNLTRANRWFQKSLDLNPFQVRAYAMLLPQPGTTPTPAQITMMERAVQYCSENSSILNHCREFLGDGVEVFLKQVRVA